MSNRIKATLLAILLVPGFALAATFHEETLDNGLRVVLIPHRANPMIASSVIVGAGALYEPAGMNGASHFLEHLLFNGTERRSQKELYDEVDLYGAYNNATTREDHTLFQLLIQKEFAAAGLDIQADMLFHSTLPPEKFEKEKGIVLEELARDRGNAAFLARTEFREFAYAKTPLSHPVLGSAESIEGLKREDVMAYYRARYVPSNMTLVVVGDLEPAAMMETVRRTFGAAPRGAAPERTLAAWPPLPEKNMRTVPLEGERTFLLASSPLSFEPHDARLTATELWVAALAGDADAPLARALEDDAEHGRLVVSFDLDVAPRADGWSTLELEAVLAGADKAPLVLERVASWLRRAGSEAVRGRIPRVRRSARAEAVLLADQIHYSMMMRSAYASGAPAAWLAGGSERFDAVSAEHVEQALATLRAAAGGMRVLLAGPGLERRESAFKPASEPAPAVEASAVAASLDTTLPSGMRVLLERNDDSQVFAVQLMLHPRSASEPAGKEGIADMLHRLMERGTVSYDRAALAARLDELGASLKTHDNAAIPYDDYYTTPEFSFLRFEMPAERWREGVRLLAEIVLRPGLAAEDIEAVREQMLGEIARRQESARSVARALFDETLAPTHPLSRPTAGTEASVASIDAEKLLAFHRRYVVGRRMTYSQVGPVDVGAALEVVRDAFAGLAAGEEPPDVSPVPLTAAGLEAGAELGKEQAQIVLGYVFDAEPQDRVALEVAGAVLSKHLAFELRERRGLAYGLGAAIEPWGGRMRLRVQMGTRQDNVEEAVEGLREEMRAFAAGAGLDDDTVRRAANARRGRLLMRRLTAVNQAYLAALAVLHGRSPQESRADLDMLLEVDAEAVRGVTGRYLDPPRCATVVVR